MSGDLPVQRFWAHPDLTRQFSPMALGRQIAVPGNPGPQTSRNGLQREDLGVQPGSLNFVRQMSGPDLPGTGVLLEAKAKSLTRNAPGDGGRLCTGIAVVMVRVDRSLRQNGPDMRALEDQRRTILLMPDKMDDAAADQVHELDRVTQVKHGRPRRKAALVTRQAMKQRGKFWWHDHYHVCLVVFVARETPQRSQP